MIDLKKHSMIISKTRMNFADQDLFARRLSKEMSRHDDTFVCELLMPLAETIKE